MTAYHDRLEAGYYDAKPAKVTEELFEPGTKALDAIQTAADAEFAKPAHKSATKGFGATVAQKKRRTR